MEKRSRNDLAVYEMEDEMTIIPLEILKSLYIEKPSEIIYITRHNKIYGVVCLGDVLRNSYGNISINTNFVRMSGFNIIQAKKMFRDIPNINKIPVVNGNGELVADYSRWNDKLFVERNREWFACREYVERILRPYTTVYIVEPSDKQSNSYLYLKKWLGQFMLTYIEVTKDKCEMDCLKEDIFIFSDEEERRGTQCLFCLELDENERVKGVKEGQKWVTYKSILLQIMKERELDIERKLGYLTGGANRKIDEKASLLFAELRKKGIHCLAIYANNSEATEYTKHFQKELEERLKIFPCSKEVPWIMGKSAEKFWGELYLLEDYQNGIVQKELLEGWLRGRSEDLDGKYCKVKSGRRITCCQPNEYIGTIYFLGPCIIFGAYVEDRYTIESYLQEKLLEMGYPYRVENYASPLRLDSELEERLMQIKYYQPNDIVIYLTQKGEVADIPNYSLWDIYEGGQVSADWVTNYFLHCNHRVNEIIADQLVKLIEPSLLRSGGKKERGILIDVHNTMKDYVYHKYITKYFKDFGLNTYNTIGAIVMNCNPFSLGHRYLIEQAKKQVDYLIIFVVEEDESIFSFEERYRMVVGGTKDLDGIMVVPSGEFILSKNTFHEYFTKVETELVRLNAEYDIRIFAEYIAKLLHITHRFAGEEPKDYVTSIYNEAMKKILPQNGITFVKIPRIETQDGIISASGVRKYLECEEYDKAFELLPESTRSFLMM